MILAHLKRDQIAMKRRLTSVISAEAIWLREKIAEES